MTRYEKLREKFKNQEVTIGTMIGTTTGTILLEKMSRNANLDFVVFDAEHGIFNAENLVPALQVSRILDLPACVRVQDAHYNLIAKLLYMGADGIMIPRTESLEQIKCAVDAMHFAPIGKLGMGGHGEWRVGEGFDAFQSGRFLLPQIESPKGIALLPEMLDKYGEYISAVIIGPYDLSCMVGTPMNTWSDVMVESVQKVFDICRERGVSTGIFCDDEDFAEKYRKMGANVLWVGADTGFFMRGFNQVINKVAELK